MELTDARLARRWRGGDGTAAALLAHRYADALGAVAFGILGDHALSEEAVQETFVQAAGRLRELRNPARVGGWLAGIGREVALDMARTHRRAQSAAASGQGSTDNGSVEAEQFRKAVAGLPDEQRDIFAMKYAAGMGYAEIGEIFGMTSEAVGQKLGRIRRKLQRGPEGAAP